MKTSTCLTISQTLHVLTASARWLQRGREICQDGHIAKHTASSVSLSTSRFDRPAGWL
jgi:hypothetical protein